jgi:hypothetical protein
MLGPCAFGSKLRLPSGNTHTKLTFQAGSEVLVLCRCFTHVSSEWSLGVFAPFTAHVASNALGDRSLWTFSFLTE